MSLKLLDTPINKQISKLQYLRGIRAGGEVTRCKRCTSEATRRRSTPLPLNWLKNKIFLLGISPHATDMQKLSNSSPLRFLSYMNEHATQRNRRKK